MQTRVFLTLSPDCHYRIAGHRIKNVLANCVLRPSSSTPSSPPPVQSLDDLQDHLHHFAVPTLPHLLALICYPPPSFPPQGTTLVVIDGVSSLFGAAFPDRPDAVAKSGKKQDDVQWASNRRFTIMAEFLTRLARLAAVRNLAVVLVSQTSIKVRQDFGAILRPAIPSKSWLDNINNRIVVFRDFFRASSDLSERIRVDVRFTGIVKLNGTLHSDLISAIPFSINKVRARLLLALKLTLRNRPAYTNCRQFSRKSRLSWYVVALRQNSSVSEQRSLIANPTMAGLHWRTILTGSRTMH